MWKATAALFKKYCRVNFRVWLSLLAWCLSFIPLLFTIKRLIMPGEENIVGQKTPNPAPDADKASNQTADPNFSGNMKDIKPEHREEVEKAFEDNIGSNKTGPDTRENHDSNERKMGS